MSKRSKKKVEEAAASSAANEELENSKPEDEQKGKDKKSQSKKTEGKHAANNKKSNKDSKTDDSKDSDEKSGEQWLADELDQMDIDPETLMKKAAEQLRNVNERMREANDKYLRLHAEWDTYRRRIKEQRAQDRAEAAEGLVKDCLPVLDDFERSINFAKENGEDGLLEGIEAVYAKLVDAFKKNGVEVLDPECGDEFDAIAHQAVGTVENTEVFDESVGNVLQKGYKMGKKVIRPAMVMVTTGGKTRPKEESEEKTE